MSLFHTHNWKVVSTDYTQSLSEQGYRITKESPDWAITEIKKPGTTHIYSKCETCGLLKQQDVTGKFTPNQ